MQLRVSYVFGVIVLLLSQISWSFTSQEIPGQFLVKYKNKSSGEGILTRIAEKGSRVKMVSEESQILLVERPLIETASYSLEMLNQIEDVEFVEPNQRVSIAATPNDPSFFELWGLVNGQKDGTRGADIKASEAWDVTTGNREVIVAVIDTGVDYNHPDLQSNMWQNTAELNGVAGADDDNNGYVDDVYGYNFADNTSNPFDDQGHGTHCSGTIGAKGNDGFGVAGVNWEVSIMAVKFLDKNGSGSLDGAIAAIDYAVKNGAKVLSNSWGGYFESEALKEAVERSHQGGVLFVAAAGNESRNNDNKATALFPASYQIDNVISVASIQKDGKMSWFSNKGEKTVHLGAPGSNIYSTVPNGQHATLSGTSMATPHVSGVAALVLSAHPQLTHLELKEKILKSVTPLAALNKKTITGGLLNAHEAVK